jgi:alpha-amylase
LAAGKSSKKVKFLFAIHNHQPVGNFDFVFEDAYRRAYRPFIEVMAESEVPFAIHNSGPLLDWLEDSHPEYLKTLRSLVKKGGLEILSGVYYEPILAAIPERDRVEQIRIMNRRIEKLFGFTPRGMWTPERVWETQFARSMARSGMEFTMLDDSHFLSAGKRPEDILGYFITEDEGLEARLFPISQKLRYLIPFRDPGLSIDYLREVADTKGNNIVVFADDGEKFGIWPGTHERVYKKGWLKKFTRLLRENEDWIELSAFSDIVDCMDPLGIIHLPDASYREMMEWTLPLKVRKHFEELEKWLKKSDRRFDNYRSFVRGGQWRNFMAIYPEANDMQKRMLNVSGKVQEASEKSKKQPRKLSEAKMSLYKAQCNCAYWHGIFGGIYLPHLREAVYSNLIKADRLADSIIEKGKGYLNVVCGDIDNDGRAEVTVTDSVKSFCIAPAVGGSIKSFEDRTGDINLLTTFARHKEAYHSRLSTAKSGKSAGTRSIHEAMPAKEKGLVKLLFYDQSRRYAFVDRWFKKRPNPRSLFEARPAEIDFSNADYDFAVNGSSRIAEIIMRAEGYSKECHVELRKAILTRLNSTGITADYQLRLLEGKKQKGHLAVELNLSFLARDDKRVTYQGKFKKPGVFNMGSRGTTELSQEFSVSDRLRGKKVSIESSVPAFFIWYPVQTVSQSESGFERIYQCSSINIVFPLLLADSEPVEVSIALDIGDT